MNASLILPGSPTNLSAAESAELAARVAALARSGLPLEGGLRALAEEVDSRRVAGALRALAARLEKGEKLETAIAAPDARLPVALRGLIVAGVESGRLPQVLELYVLMNSRQHDLRRYILATFAYPAFLLIFVSLLLILCRAYVADEFFLVFRDFGMPLPALTEAYFRYSGAIGWLMLTLLSIAIVGQVATALLTRSSYAWRLVEWMPLLGPIARYESYARFARLMSILLGADLPMPAALRLASLSMQDSLLAARCRIALAGVEAGQSLSDALARAGFLESLVCLADWSVDSNGLRHAFAAAADTFEMRAAAQGSLLCMIVLPLAYLLIVTYIGITILALLMPFLSLFTYLSGGG